MRLKNFKPTVEFTDGQHWYGEAVFQKQRRDEKHYEVHGTYKWVWVDSDPISVIGWDKGDHWRVYRFKQGHVEFAGKAKK